MAHLFVVEDSPSQAALLAGLLVEAGHRVSIFGDGAAALAAMAQMPDLILSDIAMPVMDGLALCRAVKADTAYQTIPLLLVTASDAIDVLVDGLNAQADGYLIKPYNHRMLLETVGRLLHNRMSPPLNETPSPVQVRLGERTFDLLASRERLFEFFSIAFLNASVQARELEARSKIQHELNAALSRHMELLSASEERFRSLVETLPDIVYKIDDTGRFTFLNGAVTRLGYEPGELLGRHFTEVIAAEDGEPISAATVLPYFAGTQAKQQPKIFDERRTSERMTTGLRVRVLLKSTASEPGEVVGLGNAFVRVEVSSLGMYGVIRAEQKYVGTVGVIRDISERHGFEKKLQHARDEALQANQAKSEFLSSMSHELRTPLNAVLGFAQLLASDPALSADQRENAEEIDRAGNHLLALIDDMLDLSRIEAGHMLLEMESVIVKPLVAQCFQLLAVKAEQAGITLLDEGGDGQEVPIRADPLRLQQVILNFLSNGIKYNRPQGKVTLNCRVNRGAVRISVTDTGHGIPVARQDRIFNAFDRLGQEYGTIEGTGIGLLITKRIVEAMGGTIGFESAEGQGSTFWAEFNGSAGVSPAL